MFMDGMAMNNEMIVYNALNAVYDVQIEDHHIPRIYYSGRLFGKYFAIAMSRFDGILADYEKHLSDADILIVLMQTVCVNLNLNMCDEYLLILLVFIDLFQVKGLEYLSTKNVVHNDIKPHNLFYRKKNVFIGGKFLFFKNHF